MHRTNIIIKEKVKRVLSIMLLTMKFSEKMEAISIEACQKKKKIKRGNIKEKDATLILIQMEN